MRARLATFGVVLLATFAVATTASATAGGSRDAQTSGIGGVAVDPAAVPWGDVGPGWELAAWEPHPSAKQKVNYIELVSPFGAAYAVYATGPNTQLVAWAGDRTTALLEAGDRFEVLDLATGTLTHTFRKQVPASAVIYASSFTWPQGLALYLVEETGNYRNVAVHPERVSLTGTVEMHYPGSEPAVGTFNGSMLSSADGKQVVFGAAHGLALFDNDGAFVAQLVMRQAGNCSPEFYWSATEVLADCQDGVYPRLIDFSLTTGKWRAIDQRPRGTDSGDLQAWRGGPTVYVKVASACGYVYVAMLQGDDPVYMNIPGIEEGTSEGVVDTTSTSVLVGASPACTGGREIFDWFTPATDAVRQILGPPVSGGLIDGIVGYPSTPYGSSSMVPYFSGS
jgi:TolB protein